MQNPLALAMDLSSTGDHQYALKDGPEMTLMEGSVSPLQEDLGTLLDRIQEQNQGRDLLVVLEATGMAWFPVSVFFQKNDIPIYRVKAQQSERFRKFLSRHVKNDEVDAQALGKMYYVIPNQLHELWLPLGQLLSLRRWVNRREDLVEEKSRDKNRLQALIRWVLPPLRGQTQQFTSKKMLPIIARVMDYNWVCTNMGKKRFFQWAKRQNEAISESQLKTLFKAAKESRRAYEGTDFDPETPRREAESIVRHIQFLNEEIKEVEGHMKEEYNLSLPDKDLETVYGIDWRGGAVFKSYMGDGSRFPNVDSAECWVGFIPEQNQSGDSDQKGTNIRQDGPEVVRKFLYMAANTARQWDPQIAETYYDQMVNRGKTHTQAVCKCTNKVLRRILRVLDDGEDYELRDTDDNPIDWKEAREIIRKKYTVPEKIRKQRRNRSA